MSPRVARALGAASLALASLTVAASLTLSPSATPPERLPVLDRHAIFRWVGSDRVIAATESDSVERDIKSTALVDLQAKAVLSSASDYVCILGPVSPDGRWGLFWSVGSAPMDRPPRSITHPFAFMEQLPHVREIWLPDSSGWVGFIGNPSGGLSAALYRRSAPGTAIPVPGVIPTRFLWPLAATEDGYLILPAKRWNDDELRFHPIVPGKSPKTVALHAPVGAWADTPPPDYHDPYAGPFGHDTPEWDRAYLPASNGRFVLGLVEVNDTKLRALWHRLLRQPSIPHREFWRIPLDGGAARMLLSVDRNVYQFSLAPDSKTLVYWACGESDRYERAYRTILP